MAEPKKAGEKQAKTLTNGLPPSIGKATQFKPGVSGNPAGARPGFKHISTHIQEMLNDEEFTTYLSDARDGYKEFKGAPLKAIVKTAMIRAITGDDKAREWLAKYGYGQKLEVEHRGEVAIRHLPQQELEDRIKAYLGRNTAN